MNVRYVPSSQMIYFNLLPFLLEGKLDLHVDEGLDHGVVDVARHLVQNLGQGKRLAPSLEVVHRLVGVVDPHAVGAPGHAARRGDLGWNIVPRNNILWNSLVWNSLVWNVP